MPDVIDRLDTALGDRYRVERELGEGGMATVYLAEDLKHERKVAIKVLKPELAAVIGAERFLAEIKTTASLQHPHILPLFDSGEADGFLFYVMPYVEGETLRDRLDRETQLGVDEAVGLTRKVADALHYAHRQGVVHRDIKPENILLHDGRPVVADFGIAVAISAAGGGRMTETGLSLGTPHYMSPEQATADRDVTPRSDVYSLACVLYEMLAGDPPHTGPTAQAILVRILTDRPRSVTDTRASVPPHVAAALAKALEKLPADRFESAEEFAGALVDERFRWHARPGATTTGGPGTRPERGGAGRRWPRMLPWGIAAIALVALAWMALADGSGRDARTVRLDLTFGELEVDPEEEVVISPDGSMLAVVARAPGEDETAIYLRRLAESTFTLVPGTEEGLRPVFSPDSRWILYRQGGSLVRVAPDGGGGLTVFSDESVSAWNPHWGADGSIAFTGPQGVRVIGPDGTARRTSGGGSRPFVLPDGSGVLNWEEGPGVTLTDLSSDSVRALIPGGAAPSYLASGHILYVGASDGGLFAVPFDLADHEVEGTPVRVLDEIAYSFHRRGYSLSDDGTLVVLHGPPDPAGGGVTDTRLVFVDRTGADDTVRLPPAPMYETRISPDGRFLAYERLGRATGESNIHTFDLVTGHEQPITFDGDNEEPVWSPDGERILFDDETEGGDEDLFVKGVDNRTPRELVLEMPGDQNALSWHESGLVLFESVSSATGFDLFTLRLGEDAEPEPYLQSPWDERSGRLSPDATLVAYASDETGEAQVWLRTFPEPTGRWRLSTRSAGEPRWDPAGRGVYFWTSDEEDRSILVYVPIARDDGVRPGPAEEVPIGTGPPDDYSSWDVHPDGERFLLTRAIGRESGETGGGTETDSRHLVVLDWFAELRERLGAGG